MRINSPFATLALAVLICHLHADVDHFGHSPYSECFLSRLHLGASLAKYRLEGELGLQLSFEEGSSKYFPASNSAQEVRDRLLSACLKKGATIRYKSELTDLIWQNDAWTCKLADDTSIQSQRVVSFCPLTVRLWGLGTICSMYRKGHKA